MKISYFSTGITQTEPDRSAELTEILSDIKGLALVAKTKAVRAEKDPDRQAALKAAMPYVTWSGTFSKRKKKDPFLQHSGLLCLDFDDLADVKAIRRKVEADPFTMVSFVSPRGNGLKVVLPVPPEPEHHEALFAAAANYFERAYSLQADASGKDISRACFLCHDPELYYNSKAELFDSMREAAVPERPAIELSLDGLEELDPVDRGDYYDLKCPKCGKHDAYLYKNGWVLKCSHLNSCGYESNILEKRVEAKMQALTATPKSKKLRRDLYQVLRYMDEVERDQVFKTMAKIIKVDTKAVRRDFENSVQEKAEAEFQADGGIRFAQPDSWQLSSDGIYDFKRRRITMQPLYVSALGYARKGGAEFVELVYSTNGSTKTRTVPRRTIAISKELLEQSDFGVPVTSANGLEVVRFLDAWIARNRDAMGSFVAVDQLGWDGGHFIFPDRIIGDTSGEAIHFIESTIDRTAFGRKGTLDGWIGAIKELATFPDAVVGRFLVYAAFAGMVLEPLGRRPFIIHLHGDTSTSKTTALRMVTSIFGQPVEGKGMIKWNNTQAFITRYMEKLKNIPLVIDESSGETKNIFESTIYMMEGGTSKGKALKSDPMGTAPLRTFRCAVFSSGEPPVLNEQFMSGAQVRVIEFDSGPWGGALPREQYEAWTGKIASNYGYAADAFLEHFIRIKDEIDWETTRDGDDGLTPVENRVKKFVNLVCICGIIVNELFKLGFEVETDCDRIFEQIREKLGGKEKSSDRIIADIHDFYLENQANFLETAADPLTKKITAAVPKTGKVYGYIFGQDLGIIKSVFKTGMAQRMNQPNAGDWAIHRLVKSGHIAAPRYVRQINGKQEAFVYLVNFFGVPEEVF
jgi:hypothetical protein